MPLTHFPHGISSYGLPMIGSDGIFPRMPDKNGKVYFVDGTNGLDGNTGLSPDKPLLTIGRFHTVAVSGQGDRCYVFPGSYAENLTITKTHLTIISAGGLDSQVGVTINPGSGVPLTVTTGTGFSALGLYCVGTAAIGCLQQGNSYFYRNCRFESTTVDGLTLRPNNTIANGTASGGVLLNCSFADCGDAGLAFDDGAGGSLGLGPTDVRVLGCMFHGNTNEDIQDIADTAGANTMTDVMIVGNYFMTRNPTDYIDCNQGVSVRVLIAGNFFAEDSGLTNVKIALHAGAVFTGNFDAVGVRDGSTF